MPKSPILYREGFYQVLRDGTIHELDWNIVNTTLGAMIEPRQRMAVNTGATVDPYDGVNFNKQTELNEDRVYSIFNTGGRHFPRNYNLST